MADEYYILLQEPAEFARRFTFIFINIMNYSKTLHFEHQHKIIKILTNLINLLHSDPSNAGTLLPPILNTQNDTTPGALAAHWTIFSRSVLAHLNIPNTMDTRTWISRTFS